MKPLKSRFHLVLLCHVCLLIALASCVAAEAQTINDLLNSGKLDPSLAEDGVLPEPPGEKPPEGFTPVEPSSRPAPVAAPSSAPTAAQTPAAVTQPSPFAGKVIQIGRPPYISVKGMMMAVHGLIGFIRQELGAKDVRLVTPKDYAGVTTALENGAVDFAWYGPTAYVLAAERMRLIPLAKARRRTGVTYRGVIVTRRDTGIQKLEDIKGKTIAFVDPESASGYLYPLEVLLRAKIDPNKDCAKVEFLQKHDAVMSAVWTKKVDVGAVIEDTIAAVKDPKILEQIVILGKTAEIPTDIVACRADLDPVLRERFKEALLKTGKLKQKSLATSGLPPIMEFLPVNQGEIDAVAKFLKSLKGTHQL